MLSTYISRLDELASTYQIRFAGHARATRRLDLVDTLIAGAQKLDGEVNALTGGNPDELAKLRADAHNLVQLLVAEKRSIEEAQKLGPEFTEFLSLGERANYVFANYQRHFAGQSRTTRDVGLLTEMIDDLTKIRERMIALSKAVPQSEASTLAKDLKLVEDNLALYRSEKTTILQARDSETPVNKTGLLAALANGCFVVYDNHFKGFSRTTRRPPLLARVITTLEEIEKGMSELSAQNIEREVNAKNLDIVRNQLGSYRRELTEIRKARTSAKLKDLLNELGGAANEVMADYRKHFAGVDRRTCDLDLLSVLCDRLQEIVRQMIDMGRAEANAINENNIAITLDNLALLEAEWVQVQAARTPKTA
jgi:hypothetical protein